MAWHKFRATDDGVQCITCGIEVDTDAETGFFAVCPAPRCTVGDGDDACVFVLDADHKVVCHFCGAIGGRT